jgi:hypothetical protein
MVVIALASCAAVGGFLYVRFGKLFTGAISQRWINAYLFALVKFAIKLRSSVTWQPEGLLVTFFMVIFRFDILH